MPAFPVLPMTVLVTGGTGFVGRHLVPHLAQHGLPVRVPVRDRKTVPSAWETLRGVEIVPMPARSDAFDAIITGVSGVVHLAGLAAVPTGPDAEMRLRAANVDLTTDLVAAARRHSVRQFLFLSSIRAVVGSASSTTIDDASAAQPVEPYGRSKLAAEEAVGAFAEPGRLAISLRAPLIIGPDAGGNWRRLQQLAASGAWLPFAGIRNRRSYLAVETVCAAILHLLEGDWTSEASGSYCLADPEALSLPQVIGAMRDGLGHPRRLFALPGLSWTAALPGLSGPAQSLFGSLPVDASRFRERFHFASPHPLAERIALAASLNRGR
ncbi:MAG TPA: NAD-dependent epimerase/dehydratase family protein [Tianweitania sediminis]|nr:NAD-dependent epimerase/dehydratase family protein [Tianweitania sediminis]